MPASPGTRSSTAWPKAGIGLDQVDHVAFYDKPFLKFERLLETYLAFAPKGFTSFRMAMPVWLKEKLFQKRLLRGAPAGMRRRQGASSSRLLFTEHHQSHAASAFFPSPFEEAAILTLDGVGEWATTSVGLGRGNRLEMLKELHFPHSLGLLYSAFTYYTGFKVNSGEYKLMGLAPYGEPKYAAADPRPPDRPQGRRLVPAEPGLLRLLHRPDHDQRQVRRAVRRAAAQGRGAGAPARHGPRGLDPGR